MIEFFNLVYWDNDTMLSLPRNNYLFWSSYSMKSILKILKVNIWVTSKLKNLQKKEDFFCRLVCLFVSRYLNDQLALWKARVQKSKDRLCWILLFGHNSDWFPVCRSRKERVQALFKNQRPKSLLSTLLTLVLLTFII